METIRKMIDFKVLCEAPFVSRDDFLMLVYTGKKEDEMPVFKVVVAEIPCKICFGSRGKEYWGIIAFDMITGERQWYNYNDCVSLEDWAVLDRLLEKRFGWMDISDPALMKDVKILAKAQLREELNKIDIHEKEVL